MGNYFIGQDILVYGQRTKIKEITALGSVSFEKKVRLPSGVWSHYLNATEKDAIKPLK